MPIKHNYLTVAATQPTAEVTSQHELVVNEADGGLFSKSSADAILQVGQTKTQIDAAIAAAIAAIPAPPPYDKLAPFPIGSLYLALDDVSPATHFGGTWNILPSGGSLSSGDGAGQTGVVVGDDVQPVPVEEHSHSATGTFTGTNLMFDTISTVSSDPARGTITAGHTVSPDIYTGDDGGTGSTALNGIGTLAEGTVGVSVSPFGAVGATINVAGAELIVNVWKRVA